MSPKTGHSPRHDTAQTFERILNEAARCNSSDIRDFCQFEIVPDYDALCSLTGKTPPRELTEHFEFTPLGPSEIIEAAYPKNPGLVLQELAQLIIDHVSQPAPIQDFVRSVIGAEYLREVSERLQQLVTMLRKEERGDTEMSLPELAKMHREASKMPPKKHYILQTSF